MLLPLAVLAIVREIAAGHGGTIALGDAHPGPGAIVTITLRG